MGFTVTVLGSSAWYATKQRAASGYLLEFSQRTLWVDAGGGTWRNLLQYGDYTKVDGVVLSHYHPDHVVDLFQVLHARLLGGEEPLPAIPLWAPPETMERLLGYYGDLEKHFELRPVNGGDEIEFGDARLSFVPMVHSAETLGLRVEQDGRVFAYSSDTGPDADFDSLCGRADYFVCEATLQDRDELWEGHLSAKQAGDIASRHDCRNLVLSHLPPGRDAELSLAEAHASAGDAGVRLAADGMRLEVGS